ncbi:sensor histidine kinase [Salinibacterium sp. ZJ70]|uniref:sensor histidine kinase n=1 Tax=Salinibacterium sp. ZJ70 TaxID=2708084 RepID=UPI001421A6F5|nr:histidine kinase [Salinibacterium sp. ZJ70]
MTDSPRPIAPTSDRALRWRVWPMAIVVLLGLVALGAWLADPEGATSVGGPLALASVAVPFAQAGALWWRVSHPRVVLVVTVALDLALVALSHGELSTGAAGGWFAVYTLWREQGARRALPWIGALALVSIVVTTAAVTGSTMIAPGWWVPFAIARTLFALALPLPFAEVMRSRSMLVEALRDRAETAERDREARAAEAARAERALIARELHDIAAHHLSGIVVSAQAARALVEVDPDRTRGYLDSVRVEAQTALGNLRQTLGLLREGDAEQHPLPTLATLDSLVADRVARGERVSLERDDALPALGSVAQLTVYRMVQESLSNAAAHAPGSACTVELRADDRSVRVRVHNDAPRHPVARSAGSGLGLLGMRERAALVGGVLETGPAADGGWRNTLTLPLEGGIR